MYTMCTDQIRIIHISLFLSLPCDWSFHLCSARGIRPFKLGFGTHPSSSIFIIIFNKISLVEEHLILLLICIPLMANYVKHLFMS